MKTIALTPWSRDTILNELHEQKQTWAALKIDENFVKSLISQDGDTQFIVGLAVIVEGATAAIVRQIINNDVVTDWIFKKTGQVDRLQLLKQVGKISPESFKVFVKLAEIRNAFAHRPSNLMKSLEDFYSSQPLDWQKDLQRDLAGRLTTKKELDAMVKGDVFDDTCFKTSFRDTLITALVVPLYEFTGTLS